MKCPRPGCENEATSKGRCFESYCEGWLDSQDAYSGVVDAARRWLHWRIGCDVPEAHENEHNLARALDSLSMRFS